MGLIDRLFGRRRRESVDSWARRDDSSQYLYTTDTAAASRDPDRDDDQDEADMNDDDGGDSGDSGDSGGGGGDGGGNGGGD